MIDTVRARTMLPYYVREAIYKQKRRAVVSPGVMNLLDYLPIPPYNATVTISTQDFTYVYLEASLPKIIYGHNVKLLYPSEIPSALQKIEDAFINRYGMYGDIPSYKEWEIQRIDPCYGWKFDNDSEVVQALRFLHNQDYPLKGNHWYKDETVTFGSKTFSVTFYNKQVEFLNQYKKLIENGFSKEAEEGLSLSKGVLRYEVRLRKTKLSKVVGKQKMNYKDLLNLEFYYNILNACLTKALHNPNRNSLSNYEAMKRLRSMYKKEKAANLFNRWKTYYSTEPGIKEILKDNSNPTTIARYLKDISLAGVGIPDNSCSLPFDLSIPSINAVTLPPAPVALATGQVKGIQEMFDIVFKSEKEGAIV